MEWLQVLSLFLANAGLIFWFRSESRADWRHLDAKMDQRDSKMNARMEKMSSDTNAILKSIQDEMKDFHGRLCSIEERKGK